MQEGTPCSRWEINVFLMCSSLSDLVMQIDKAHAILPDDHVQGDKLPEPRGGWVNEFHDVWPNVEGINVKSNLQLPQP